MTDSKQHIQTNLLGKLVMLTEDAKHFGCLHSYRSMLWDAGPDGKQSFVGDYAKVPGGEHAVAEIVSVYLSERDLSYVTVCWREDGSLAGFPVDYFRVIGGTGAEYLQSESHPPVIENWDGWYIFRADAYHGPRLGLVDLRVILRHTTNGVEPRTILATLSPFPVGEILNIKAQEYGEPGTNRQSVVVTAFDAGSEASYSIQVDVNHKTGKFKEESLEGWEEV